MYTHTNTHTHTQTLVRASTLDPRARARCKQSKRPSVESGQPVCTARRLLSLLLSGPDSLHLFSSPPPPPLSTTNPLSRSSRSVSEDLSLLLRRRQPAPLITSTPFAKIIYQSLSLPLRVRAPGTSVPLQYPSSLALSLLLALLSLSLSIHTPAQPLRKVVRITRAGITREREKSVRFCH